MKFISNKNSVNTLKIAVKSVLCGFLICFAISMTEFDAQSQNISDEIFRLHIMANSDSVRDQSIKLKVRDRVQQICSSLFSSCKTKEQAESIACENMEYIVSEAQKILNENNINENVNGEIVNMYFTNRTYDDFTLPAGNYDALRITIGSGNGHNWWCVMFPPMCVSACADFSDVLDENQIDMIKSDNIEYKFKVYEVYENLISKIEKR